MTRLALIRHGSTDWNEAKRVQGHVDRPLSPAGAAAVAHWRLPVELTGFDWVASPLRRAMDTARTLLDRDVPAEPAVIEMAWGAWEGHTLAELRAELGPEMAMIEALGLDFKAPGGESPREVQARLLPWLRQAAGAGRPIAAVTHKGVIRAALGLATGWSFLGEAPAKLDWSSAHLFRLQPSGVPEIEHLNIPLVPP